MTVSKKESKFEQLKKIAPELIHTRVYPKEESWRPLCPHCGKPLFVKLVWNQDACEFQLLLVKGK